MADNTASDVRSVISNATRLKPDNSRNPVMRGLQGKNDTIATKEEIQASKGLESSPLTAKSAVANFRKNTGVAQTTPNFKASDYQTSTQKTAQEKMMSTPEDKVSSDTVVNRGAMRTGIEATGYSDPNQINDSGTQIAGVEIQGPQGNAINAEQEANKPTVGQRFGPTGIGRYQQKQEAALEERKINMGNTLTNLYATVNDRLNNRGLYTSLEDVRQYIPELNEYNDATVNQIISDMTYLSQQGGNDTQNLLSLFEAYGLDAELQFEQLDDVTKGEYLAYLANAGREEQAPGWMDYIANIFVNRDLDLDRNMTLGEFLESTSEEAQKGKVTTKQLKGAQVADYRNLLNKYAEYYTVTDQKALNSRFDTYLKWQNKKLSAKEAADKGDNIWYERGGIQDMIQWKDKEKEKEFKKEYNKLLGEKEKGLIKNVGQNALIGATNLASGMYSFFNNLLTIDTTNGVKIASPSAKGVIQLGLGTAINTYENITGKEQAGDTIKELGNSMEANGGWAGKFLNGIIQNSEESASFLWNDYIVPNYGSVEKFMDSLTDDPVNTISDVVTVWELSTRLAGKVGIGGKTYKLDPKTGTVMYDRKGNPIQVSKLSLVADDIAKLDPATWMGAAYGKVGETALKVTTAPVKGTFKILGKGASKLIDNIASKATGLSKEQRDFIRDNPELVQDFLKGDRTADDLIKEIEDKYGSEKAAKMAEGRIFELLKKDQTPLDTRGMLYKIQDAFGELGVVIDKAGKIQFTKPIEDSVKARITKAYEYINSIANGSAKAGDVHWAREGIGGLTKWDQGHAMTAQESMMNNAMKTVYNGIGEVLKTQVKGWAEADAEYSRIINVLNDFKDWFDKEGKLKDSAYSKINNLTNKNNKAKLERLKKYFPEIERDLKALATANSVEKATQATAGQYLTAFMSGIGGAGLVGMLSGSLTLGFALKAILGSALLTPKNFVKVLEYEGKFNKFVRGIADKLKKGGKMTTAEADELGRLMQENPEYYKEVVNNLTKKGILKNIEEQKANLKQQLKEGQISQKEYDKLMGDLEYNKASVEAAYGREGNLGATEREVTEAERAKLEKKYGEKAENLGFVVKLAQDLGEGERGYFQAGKKVNDSIYALSKNPTSTTAQHEFFHAVFSLVDENTKKYVLDEVRKALKDNNISDLNAEEFLAESFGIYAARKDLKLGVLDAPKTLTGKVKQAIKDLFQKTYEWIQGYNADRKLINKMFDDIYGGKTKLAGGKIDLSYLLGEKNAGGLKGRLGLDKKGGLATKKAGDMGKGIKYKKTFHGGGDFDEFSLEHVGEGEGNTAHGYGIYVTENKSRAKDYGTVYRNKKYGYTGLSQTEEAGQYVTYKGQTKGQIRGDNRYLIEEIIDRMQARDDTYGPVDAQGAINLTKRRIKTQNSAWAGRISDDEFKSYKASQDKDLNFLDSLDPKDFKVENAKRNLYEVEAPNKVKRDTPTGSNYLEEAEGITNEAYKAINAKLYEANGEKLGRRSNKVDGKELYGRLTNALGSKKAASEFLQSLGYDGIHYIGELDGSSYVVFNPKGLDIKNKIKYKRTFHGSPHEFSKFDSSHMGEGEGAQAHGWGHYVAVSKETGERYANMNEANGIGVNITIDGQPYKNIYDNLSEIEKESFDKFKALRLNDYTNQEARDVVKHDAKLEISEGIKDMQSMIDYANSQINLGEYEGEQLKRLKGFIENDKKRLEKYKLQEKELYKIDELEKRVSTDRNLYEVEIPDPIKKDTPTGSNYIEEDGKITKSQLNKIADALEKYAPEKILDKGENLPRLTKESEKKMAETVKRSGLYQLRNGELSGEEMYRAVEDILGSDKAASQFLNSLGYDGIHYFGGRDGEAYVIFNDKGLDIKSHTKYKKDLGMEQVLPKKDSTGKELTEGQRKYFAKTAIKDSKGNLVPVYHGTNAEYTVYDPKELGSGSGDLGFFGDGRYFATHKGEAKYYGSKIMEGYLNIEKPYYYDDLYKIDGKKISSNYVGLRNLGQLDEEFAKNTVNGYTLKEIGDMVDDYLKNTKLEKLNDGTDIYGPMTYWRVTTGKKSEVITAVRGFTEDEVLNEELNRYMQDKVGFASVKSTIMDITDNARFYKTKSLQDVLKAKGHDGIVVGDSVDRADEIVAFSSNQFKNLDNLNPTKSEDIRFKKDVDTNGAKLSEGQQKYFKDSKVRDAEGRLVPVYHFTNSEFNTVDFKKGMQNYFWFTSDAKAIDRAVGSRPGVPVKRKDMYVDIKNPAGWDEYEKFGADELKARGYDGVILKDKDGFEGFIFDRGNQVKYTDNLNPTRASKDMRYKKDINPTAKEPEELIQKDSRGLDEMASFVSEKQKEKAMDVNKVLLSENGNPYMWTHTNKYTSSQFADFQNAKDSHYKGFKGVEVGRFSNNETMSRSYADDQSVLAKTKKFNNVKELNDYLKENKQFIQIGNRGGDTVSYEIREVGGKEGFKKGYGLYRKLIRRFEYENINDLWNTFRERNYSRLPENPPKDKNKALEELNKARERVGGLGTQGEIRELPNGKYEHIAYDTESLWEDPRLTEKEALAEGFAAATAERQYSYQGVIQNVKKPLVVEGKGRNWNRLGTLNDIIGKQDDELGKAINKLDKYDRDGVALSELIEEGKNRLQEDGMFIKENMAEDKYYFLSNIQDAIDNNSVYMLLQNGEWLGDEYAKIKNDKVVKGMTFEDLHQKLIDLDGTADLLLADRKAHGTLGEVLDNLEVDKGTRNIILHTIIGEADENWAKELEIKGIKDLWKKMKVEDLQTNDYVFYALNKGGYDGVIFKDIVDYGGYSKENKPGDVLATFHSNQFKAWNNEAPTESKYMSYKKNITTQPNKNSKGLAPKSKNNIGLAMKVGYKATRKD